MFTPLFFCRLIAMCLFGCFVAKAQTPDGFALIPAGSFQMGDSNRAGTSVFGAFTIHTVSLSDFYIGKYEVTKELWDEVRAWGLNNGYTDLPVGNGNYASKGANHPVHSISWHSMVNWCNARSQKEGLAPCYFIYRDPTTPNNSIYYVDCDWNANGYRLPTEAEWEKAARGGVAGFNYPWGNTISFNQANYYNNGNPWSTDLIGGYHPTYYVGSEPYTSPVGSFAPNGYGLYDVVGNAEESCWDWYNDSYYEISPPTNPRGPIGGHFKIRRGVGSLFFRYYLVASRNFDAGPDSNSGGFRLARTSLTGPPSKNNQIVTGRVINAATRLPLAGAAAAIAGANTTSGTTGSFLLTAVDRTMPTTCNISANGFLSQTRSVELANGVNSVDLGDIFLTPATDKPVVEYVKLKNPRGVYIRGLPESLRPALSEPIAEVKVNWNGNRPGKVEFWADDQQVWALDGAGNVYERTMFIDTYFKPSLAVHELKVIAKAAPLGLDMEGKASDPMAMEVFIVGSPDLIKTLLNSAIAGPGTLGVDIKLKLSEKTVTLPVIGTYGAKFDLGASFDYKFDDGSWELALGGGTTNLKTGKRSRRPSGSGSSGSNSKSYVGKEIDISLYGIAKGSVKTDPFELKSVSGELKVTYEGELTRLGLNDVILPGSSIILGEFQETEALLKNVSIALVLKVAGDGTFTFKPVWPPDFEEATLTTTAAVEAVYEGGLAETGIKLKLYAGGEGKLVFGKPEPYFREAGFKIYAGIEANLWVFDFEREWVLLEYEYSGSSARSLAAAHDTGSGYLVEAEGNRLAEWQPMKRPWREQGAELFTAGHPTLITLDQTSPQLDEYARMEKAASAGAVYQPPTRSARSIVSSPALPAQAELPLLQNVFPNSEPALAARGNHQMLLYVRDTGAANPVHFTEIAWTRFDGTSWSTPATLRQTAGSTLTEGFNNPTVPAGWAVNQPDDLEVLFETESINPEGLSPTEGSHLVRVNNFDVGSGTVRLRKTVPFATTGLAEASVAFDWSVDSEYSDTNDRVSVEWSADGSTWNSFGGASRYAASGTAWTTRSFNLPPAALGRPAVYVSFLFTTEYGNDCHLDNVRISLNQPFVPDARGQFSPKVAFDGAGNAVAVWERIKDPALTASNMDTATAQMEIATAKWTAATGTWGAVTALTDNNHVDHSTEIAGPLTDGDLLLTWRENTADLLVGTAASPSRVLTRRWDAATSTWGAVQVLVDGLSGELSTSLSAAGNKAIFLLSRDQGNDFATEGDTELFHRVWNETTATWSALTRYTNDALADRNAKVALDATGQIYALWQRGTELVMDRNLAGTPTTVRADATTAGFSDFILTLAPGGNVVALWQEMTDFGSDAHYRVFDPASDTWGLDTLLSQDSDLERSFSPAWDAMGNLVLAYNNVIITKQNKTVTLEGGEIVEVTGVPQPGRVDLLLAKRALVKDLSISANGLTAEGTTYLPGDAITLKAKVKNTGNVAVLDVPISFYDGNPAAGGTLIQTVTLPGWLKAADEAETTVNWTIPQPAIARTVYVKVDPAGIVTESDETNNSLALPLNGVDLEAQYISGSVLRDGSVRVVVRVTSLSAPESPVTMLRLKTETGTTALAEVNVSQLSPGDSLEIPLELPAGSHPEGERAYRVTLDEEALTGDVDVTNNEVLFRLNLWIDDDNDDLPNEWEVVNGLSDANAADALLDSDGDGFNNRLEYLAGTNPQNGASVLKIGEVAQRSIAAGGGVAISWASTAGRLYNLERTYDLTNWVVLSRNTTATPPLNTVIDPTPAPFGKAFYRLVLLESTDAYDYAPLTRSIAFQAAKQETQATMDAQLSWDSLAGKSYAVERSIDLVSWQVIAENIPATLPRNTYTDRAPLSQTKAFYRVLER